MSPKLEGRRFDDHTLPVSLLEDFTALEELIFEVAKQIYLEENPGRKRVPKGFTDTVELKLASVEEGSTISNFILANTISAVSLLQPPSESYTYLEKAKDKIFDIVSRVNNGQSIAGAIETKYLNYFNKIGKNLQEGESMNLAPGRLEEKAVLTKTVRRRLLLSRTEKQEYADLLSDNASVTAIDKADNTFTLDINGNRVVSAIDEKFANAIRIAYDEYEKNTMVTIKATGIYNAQDKLIRIEAIESMDILDPFDVALRLQQLSILQPGWYNGDGKAPDKTQLKKFGDLFSLYFGPDLQMPAIFPTVDGNIQLEWDFEKGGIMLEVQLTDFTAEYLYTYNGEVLEEANLNFTVADDWQTLNTKISQFS